jgi:hypothetical protein
LQSEQTLLGGGGAIQVRGRTSGTVAFYTVPGTRPTVAGGITQVIRTADNTHISGIEVDGTGVDYAIRTYGVGETVVLSNVRALDAMIGYNTGFGSDGSTVTIHDSLMRGTNTGVWLDSAGTVEITFSALQGGSYGLYVNGLTTLTLADTTFVGAPSQALIAFTSSGSTSTVAAGSTGNINATSNDADECVLFFSTFTGTLGFDTGDVTAANC